MLLFILNFISLFFLWSNEAIAGGFIAVSVLGLAAGSLAASIVGFAINMVASTILSKLFAPNAPSNDFGDQVNPGSKQQLPPSGSNKLPIIYGNAWTGGIITDLSITSDNQDIYWVIALCEVTNTQSGVSVGAADKPNFGEVYWGGKRVLFSNIAGERFKVYGLEDTSNKTIINVYGYMDIWLYDNGSDNPYNSTIPAYTVLSNTAFTNKPVQQPLIYTWNSSKKMTNTAFAIVHLKYNSSVGTTALNQTKFQIQNARSAPGSCILDYLTNVRYGAGIPLNQIDTASLTDLNNYSNQVIQYTDYQGNKSTQKRFVFNGSLDTDQRIMTNLQTMSDCCNSLIRFNEITSKWGVVVQKPTFNVAMDFNDSNILGPITITPIDISNTFNFIECKFADKDNKDSFSTVNFDLAVINPSLLFANEPVNKQSVSLNLVNNSVQAQYIANQLLEAAREDLQIQLEINYKGLQLQAGDIVTITNVNYGWAAKLFRINKVIQRFNDKGQVTATLSLSEFTPSVYDDKNVTEFIPSDNTGIGSATGFGAVPAPVITNKYPSANPPYFTVQITTSSSGIVEYAELWYSASQSPTPSQLFYIGTTDIQSNGDPYANNQVMPILQVSSVPSGRWYFFSRMVNSVGKSSFSPASSML